MLKVVVDTCIRRQNGLLVSLKKFRRMITSSLATHEKVCVRLHDDSCQLSFKYRCKNLPERQFNFNRRPDEELNTVFSRISTNIKTALIQKNRRKKEAEDQFEIADFEISLTFNEETIDGAVKNRNAWKEGAILKVGNVNYEVIINAPTVKSMALPKNMMAGFPVYPKLELEFANREDSDFVWYKTLNKKEKQEIKNAGEEANASIVRTRSGVWKEVGRSFYFMTSVDDVGRRLKVVCIPKLGERSGFEVEAESSTAIEVGPGPCPFDERHLYTKDLTDSESIRCISYNILADLYADSEYSRQVLFPYCPPYALELDYRKRLFIKEILGYNGDIICLQEVDNKVYSSDLPPLLRESGLEGVFCLKGGQVAEGLACFYRTSKFRLVNSYAIIFSEAIQTDPLFSDLLSKISENENLKQRMLARTTALQVVLLECVEKGNHKILAANTHLYFHPEGGNIRLLQAAMCVRYLQHKLDCLHRENPSSSVAILLCGDFNSPPEYAVYQLMTTGSISEENEDWKSNPDEVVQGIRLRNNLPLASAYGCPPYTNFTSGFSGCLDYIFYDTQNLDVAEVVPLPSHEQVTEHTALPSVTFPSDHIALVSSLKWRQQQ